MRRRTPLAAAALFTAATALLTGCGLTDDAPQPGVAADVAGQSVQLSTIDDVVVAYCGLLASEPGAPVYARSTVRSQLAWNWAQSVAVEKLADQYGATLPADTIDPGLVERTWGLEGDHEDDFDSFEWLTRVSQRLADPLLTIGSQSVIDQTGQPADQDTALAAGFAVVDAWLAEQDVTLNPVLGTRDPAKNAFLGDDLSVAVSATARKGNDLTTLTPEQAAALPANERCGSAAQPQAQPGA